MKFAIFNEAGIPVAYLIAGINEISSEAVEISDEIHRRMTNEHDGVWKRDAMTGEIAKHPLPGKSIVDLKAEKNNEINQRRLEANFTTFVHAGRLFACDQLSRSDIDGVANHIGLTGAFPPGFPGGWKAFDNSVLAMPTTDDFREFYGAMTAQGSANFNRSQALKAELFSAETDTPEKIDALAW